ncbi:anti-sigma factor family protein [Streptomyces sp. enrichment culture]|uniref:anti-sigma factor family protein n=1 Tax=Streptomyces sp. enrichment culture TaxID=1795815 RepID=UPI003F57B9D6
MSGSLPTPPEGHLAEQHLGDRLSALVDGELGHDARERVLAHVATCAKCKAEVDAQRRLKNVFAQAAPPPPSESFLARLQGLPGGDPGGGSPLLGGGPGVFDSRRGEGFEFAYQPARPHGSAPPDGPSGRGFRIHDVSRHDTDRPASRGLRFAFVAAGAVSLAAIALGGVTTSMVADTEVRGAGKGSNVTPTRTQGTGAATTPESQRRRGAAPLIGHGTAGRPPVPAAPTGISAPLLPGLPPPAAGDQTLTAPMMAGAAAVSPLIRPLPPLPPLTPAGWSTPSGIRPPTLLDAAPAPASPSALPQASASSRAR